jgi:hypothetical protein
VPTEFRTFYYSLLNIRSGRVRVAEYSERQPYEPMKFKCGTATWKLLERMHCKIKLLAGYDSRGNSGPMSSTLIRGG